MIFYLAFQANTPTHHQHISIANASPLYSLSVDLDAKSGDPDDPIAGPAVVKIILRSTGKPIQSIRMPSLTLFKGSYSTSIGAHDKPPSTYDDSYSFVFEDFDFDGHQDLAICKDTSGSYGGLTYDVFRWIPAQKQFVKDSALSALSSEHLGLVSVDAKKQELTAFDKSGAAWHKSSTYKWHNKKLILVEDEIDDATGAKEVITTRTKIGARWHKTVRRLPINRSS